MQLVRIRVSATTTENSIYKTHDSSLTSSGQWNRFVQRLSALDAFNFLLRIVCLLSLFFDRRAIDEVLLLLFRLLCVPLLLAWEVELTDRAEPEMMVAP